MEDCNEGTAGDGSNAARNSHDVSLSLDAILGLLAHRRRRDVLYYLCDTPDGVAAIHELVEELVEREAERLGGRPDSDNIAIDLHNVHLPKLADAGVIEYDPRSKQVRYRRHGRVERWLAKTEAEERG